MKIGRRSKIDDVQFFNLNKFVDDRGLVIEAFNKQSVAHLLNNNDDFPCSHETFSKKNVLRGIHYQVGDWQSRLVRVSYGAIYDVILDLRLNSPTFGMWQGEILTSDNPTMIWLPSGLAHAYLVLSDFAIINIHSREEFCKENQRVIRWNDPYLAIDWPLYSAYPIIVDPIVSNRDALGSDFMNSEYFS